MAEPSEERAKSIADQLVAKAPRLKCSACSSTQFEVVMEAAIISMKAGHPEIIPARYLPAVAVACKVCGHLDFFSQLGLGIMEMKS
jgi:hypothetical protein